MTGGARVVVGPPIRVPDPLAAAALAATAISVAEDVHGVLSVVVEHARGIIGAHQAIASLTTDARFAQEVAAISMDERYRRWADYDAPSDGSGIYSVVCRENRPMRLSQSELEAHPAWRGFGDAAAEHPPMRGWLAVPLTARHGGSIGLLQLSDRESGDFTEEDEAVAGQLAAIAAVAIERLRIEDELRAERDRARALFESSQDGVVVIDDDLRIADVSPSFVAMTGLSAERLVGTGPPFPFSPSETPGGLDDVIRRVRDGEREFDLLLRRADGTLVDVLVTVSPLSGEGGRVTGVAATFKDVTARRREVTALRESRAALAEAQEIAHVGNWSADLRTGAYTWSDEAYRLHGLVPGSHVDRAVLLSSVHPNDREKVRMALEHGIYDGQFRVVHPDGTVRVLQGNGRLERGPDGRPARAVGTTLDVTELRAAERRAIEREQEVEALAEARRKLVVDALDAEDRARQRIADVLHDDVLQEILAARQDVAEAIRDVGEEARLRRALDGIARSAAHLRGAVADLHPVTLAHAGVASAFGAMTERVAGRYGIETRLDVDPAAEGADARLLLSVGRELLANVVRHARAATVDVCVEALPGAIRLSVSDDGVGVRAGAVGRAVRVGHIGLASARERVAAVGGTLDIGPRPEGGTRAVVVLPRS